VIAFDTCGLSDIIEHQHTGYLAKAFDTEDLAAGIAWVVTEDQAECLGEQARKRAVTRFANSVVVEQYLNVYAQALGRQ
jgi:glycosyltransferase involved in cell wall biosynthesis